MENKEEKQNFVGMSDTMKHYELEKLVLDWLKTSKCWHIESGNMSAVPMDGLVNLLSLAFLADKQGYMRGLEAAIDLYNTHPEGMGGYCDTGSDMEWGCRSECVEIGNKQAHDAISKLKEK